MLLALLAAVVGGCLHSAGGFGFALVLGPALLATTEPSEALTALLILGLLVNALVLVGERRPLHVRTSDLVPLLAAGIPGLLAGAAVVQALPKPALQAVVGAVIIAAALVQATTAARRRARASATSRASAWPVGLAAGVLTTSTTVNGPPLMLWLQGRGATPEEVRDSLAASFVVLNVAGAGALMAVAGPRAALDLSALLPLLPALAAGQVLGRAVFRRLDERRFRLLGLGLVVAAGVASLASGVAAM